MFCRFFISIKPGRAHLHSQQVHFFSLHQTLGFFFLLKEITFAFTPNPAVIQLAVRWGGLGGAGGVDFIPANLIKDINYKLILIKVR